jgi:SPX domain protein involved in polyphosphate accumulation
MRFAREIEHDLVPEWRAKYLNYKVYYSLWMMGMTDDT